MNRPDVINAFEDSLARDLVDAFRVAASDDEIGAVVLTGSEKAFSAGADYHMCVQKVYGHLVMTREVMARVLAERIAQDYFDQEYELTLARQWFYDNLARIYKLDLEH